MIEISKLFLIQFKLHILYFYVSSRLFICLVDTECMIVIISILFNEICLWGGPRQNIFFLGQECVDMNCDDSITIAGELWAGQRGNNHRLIDN